MKLKNIYCHKLKYIYHNSGRCKPWGEDEWTQDNLVNLLLLFAFCPAGGDTPPLVRRCCRGDVYETHHYHHYQNHLNHHQHYCVQHPAAPAQSPPAAAHRLEADLSGVPLSSDCGDAPDGKPGTRWCVDNVQAGVVYGCVCHWLPAAVSLCVKHGPVTDTSGVINLSDVNCRTF